MTVCGKFTDTVFCQAGVTTLQPVLAVRGRGIEPLEAVIDTVISWLGRETAADLMMV
jgi:hypothetical protein